MNRLAIVAATGLLAVPLIFAPVSVQVAKVADRTVTVEVGEKTAEARSRSRRSSSRRSSSRRKSSSSSRRKPSSSSRSSKKGCAPRCSASGKKGKLNTKSLFGKGTKTKKAKPTATTKRKSPTATKSATKKAKPTATKRSAAKTKIGGKSRPKLTKSSRTKATSSRRASLKSPKATKSRLKSQRAGSTRMRARTRMQSRRMRASVAYYPGGRYGYHRNRYYAGYHSTWGWGYRPGYTYHRGWGTYGYGYTRRGIGIIDAMILYSIFGHSNTSRGDTVVNNNTYIINGEKTEVTAVPEGSRLTGFGSKKKLIVPSKDGNEIIEIPAGSTFTKTENGLLITTPDGVAVLVPLSGSDSYKAADDYKVPAEAAEAMVYEDLTK